MADDQSNGKKHVAGKIPPDDYREFVRLRERWGVNDSDAFRRIFSDGLDAQKGLREYLKIGVVNLAVIAVVMWIIGRVMPNIPADNASMAAFLTFGVAALGVVVIGLLDTDLTAIRTGSKEAAD